MIGMTYTMALAGSTQSSAKTLMTIDAASTAIVTIEKISISQSTIDASENTGTTIQVASANGTGTSGTAFAQMAGFSTFGGAIETNHTAEPTYTAGSIHWEQGWNILSGFIFTPANDDDVIVLSPSGILGFNLDVAITSADLSFSAVFREVGT